jgi:hypothetical protein
MTETDENILHQIKTWVWSGFYTPDDVDERIGDLLEEEEDADEAMLRAAVAPEFAAKARAEAAWPGTTDCDRLDQAFAKLDAQGIIALHNAGYTMSDGISDVAEVLHQRGRDGVQGYCFYHGQDVERAIEGAGLSLAFGDLNDDPAAKAKIGQSVKEALKNFGFTVVWNGDPETRLDLPAIDWKRRTSI